MPRVADVYAVPAGTDGISNGTISSSKYNGFVHDVESDLNLARPILAGGTGATSASAARTSLQAEASKQVVTNYDSMVWENGSFYSAAGATNSPTINAFTGIAYASDASNIVVEARDMVDGIKYMRKKSAGTWGAWLADSGSGAFVLKSGDTMTGNLTISKPSPAIVLNKGTGTSDEATIIVARNGFNRWVVSLVQGTAETGGSVGSDFGILRYNDAGTFTGIPLQINRADGQVNIKGTLNVANHATPTQGLLSFAAPASNKYLLYDGTAFQLNGGNLNVAGGINCTAGFNAAGTSSIKDTLLLMSLNASSVPTLYLYDEVPNPRGVLGWTRADNTINLNYYGQEGLKLTANGRVSLGTGFLSRPGMSGPTATAVHNFNWTGGASIQAWVDVTNLGIIAFTSDYRTKKDVEDLHGTWEAVKGLRPIKYTQADYTPEGSAQLFVADDVERWGFLAHELQDTLIEHAATGVKDDPVHVQSPNPWVVIAALTKALQEAMTRIEALEARQ